MSTQHHRQASIQFFTLSSEALATFDTLSTIAGQYPLAANPLDERREQSVLYFDTADYRLLRTGFAVCVEQDREQALLTIANLAVGLTGKVDKQIVRRKTVTEAITDPEVAASLKAWPKTSRKAVASVLSSHAKLHPILLIQRQRTGRTITASPTNDKTSIALPRQLATVNLDNITVWQPIDEVNHGNTPASDQAIIAVGQLIVEFAPGDGSDETVAAQEMITTWLANQLGSQPVASEHQRLLEEVLPAISRYAPNMAAGVGLQPHMLIADGCRLIWREQLMAMLLNEAGVRYSQGREYVHNMRIAIRRARAAAKLYGHFWPRKTIRPYLAALRKTGHLLGHIRNLDVTIAKARRTRNQNGEKVQAPKKLVKAWRQQRQAAQQKLIHWLDSSEYSDFVAEFQRFCTIAEVHSKHHVAIPTPQQVRHVIPSQILAGYAAVRCYEALFEAALPVDYATLHNLRIACKYLRYNLEFVHHLLAPESETLITHLKGLQELLGDLNDAVIAETLIDETKQGHDADPYRQAQAQRMAELSKEVPAALAALVDPESRAQLANALSRL